MRNANISCCLRQVSPSTGLIECQGLTLIWGCCRLAEEGALLSSLSTARAALTLGNDSTLGPVLRNEVLLF